MCGACGRTVVPDPVLGAVRTLRQHLIVAQTVNQVCQSWAGAPKVTATSGGWLVARPTGAIEAVMTVEALWTSVLRGTTGAGAQSLGALRASLPKNGIDGIPSSVVAVGQRLLRELDKD